MSGFLPINREDMKREGIVQLDFVYVIGDAYVDHPSFGHAVIRRMGIRLVLSRSQTGKIRTVLPSLAGRGWDFW